MSEIRIKPEELMPDDVIHCGPVALPYAQYLENLTFWMQELGISKTVEAVLLDGQRGGFTITRNGVPVVLEEK